MNVPEYISDGAWETVRRVVGTLFRLLIDTGGLSVGIRFGVETVTWPGGAARAGNATVTHGLGKTPVVVLATTKLGPSSTWFPVYICDTYTATDFVLRTVTSDGSSPAAASAADVAWLVLG